MPDIATISAFLGSIKTAKETLTLILDASKTLEKAEREYKIAALTKTLTELENQALNFDKILREKDEEIQRLKNLLSKKTTLPIINLPEECIEILKLLSKSEDEFPLYHIAQTLKQNFQWGEQKTRYFLDKLENAHLITPIYRPIKGEAYSLNEKGREVLFEKRLL